MSITKWIEDANNGGSNFYGPDNLFITFKEDILSNEYMTFDISVILENGEKHTTKTIPIKIIE